LGTTGIQHDGRWFLLGTTGFRHGGRWFLLGTTGSGTTGGGE
jgi:hypothetical protein